MTEAKPDLPPVGELVQITDQQGQVSLGYRHHQESKNWLERLGKPPIRLADVQSWCRVLVLPDTDETREAMTAAAAQEGNDILDSPGLRY